MRMRKFTAFILLVCFLFSSQVSFAIDVTATGACVKDFASGEIIYEKNADMPLVPASMTKIMTLFLIYEGLERNDYQKDTPIPVSANAAMLSRDREATNVVLQAGSTCTVDELINMITVVSACAAATVFAEYISGSESAFAQLMTRRASELGLNAYFEDASGLSDNNRITPRSVATLVHLFIEKYPDILNYTSKTTITAYGKTYESTNHLLPGKKFFYDGADGFKTGTTRLAGKCLVSTAQRNNERVIAVSMKSTTVDSRYHDAVRLLDYGFEYVNTYNSFVYSTDIRTFIDGLEIPCCYFLGRNKALLIAAENLNGYGFTTHYNSEEKTLYIYEAKDRERVSLSVEKLPPGQKLFILYKDFVPEVVLVKDGTNNRLSTVYSTNGQCLIDVDELKTYYPYEWNDELRTATLTIQ